MNTDPKNIIDSEYSDIMQQSYIDYAMSVIISRAIPDIRDGLKPVQRRTLYDMGELGLRSDRPYRKCARIVGDTMGKYHPHGDSSIYDSLVVMAQDFKKGKTLVDGHGNFGSIEGDGAAAMRYTEARLEPVTEEAFLKDLDKNTVDFVPNFDETEKEPEVLPVKIPNFLVNGSEGIAVGMATSAPTHNLKEVVEAEKAYLNDPDITTEGLMHYIKGPDFPTGGIITNASDLPEIYETGIGKIKIRGRVSEEKGKNGRKNLVVSEIPYTMIGAGIGKFMSDVIDLVESRKTTDILDISNQSSKEGIRIVIECKRDSDTENLKNLLYSKTKLEDTFGVNMLAVHDGRPETMGLKAIFSAHTAFLYELNTRKYSNLLEKEESRSEIQEGLIKATDLIDLIIETLRGSRDRATVMRCLTTGDTKGIKFKSKVSEKEAQGFNFTENQAAAILDMRLAKLIGLELEALLKEHDETLKAIARYKDILAKPSSMKREISKELDDIAAKYGRERLTEITDAVTAVFTEKPIEEADVYFVMDRFGYARTIDTATYDRNKEAIDSDDATFRSVFLTKNTGRVGIFTNTGMLHIIRVLDLPMTKLRDKGVPIDNLSKFDSSKENFVYIDDLESIIKSKLLFVSRHAMMKLVEGSEFDVMTKRTVAATSLGDGDELFKVKAYDEENDRQVLLQTEGGFFIRFAMTEIPEKKKGAVGVRGMKLSGGDRLEELYFMNFADERVIDYKGKEMALTHVKLSKRDGKGTKVRV
ncbi:MAG: DNA topoisomerase 4 subunit A [Lachnospiraceae bacterium]|nr:DNA topoisomerase 4 subunit A [Lachnospiraceae bacterium]